MDSVVPVNSTMDPNNPATASHLAYDLGSTYFVQTVKEKRKSTTGFLKAKVKLLKKDLGFVYVFLSPPLLLLLLLFLQDRVLYDLGALDLSMQTRLNSNSQKKICLFLFPECSFWAGDCWARSLKATQS